MISKGYKDTGAMPSLLGFGCMRLPRVSEDSQDIDYEKAQALIDYAYAHGVNYFDTAYMYHGGKSELFIGQALKKYPRDSYFLTDKMPTYSMKEEAEVDRIFQDQLHKCGVEYFDFYLCHGMDHHNLEKFKNFHVIEYLKQKKAEGRIKRLGFSFHDTPAVLQEILKLYDWDFAQIQLNYIDWQAQDAKGQYELLANSGIPVVVMEPVRGGALAKLCPEAAQVLKDAAPDKSLASWAIRFAASQPAVMTVLSGMSDEQQVVDNIRTMEQFAPLSAQEQATLDRAGELFKKHLTIPCTGCRYCMPCPAGVDIPGMFKLYNEFTLSGRGEPFLQAYDAAPAQQAAHCVACGRCTQRCPQHLPIPEKMQEIRERAEKMHAG